MGSMKNQPPMASTEPTAKAKMTSSEKWRRARARLPSPKVLATSALPPVPTIMPTEAKIITAGKIRFTAARAVLPAKLDTKNPSTMV